MLVLSFSGFDPKQSFRAGTKFDIGGRLWFFRANNGRNSARLIRDMRHSSKQNYWLAAA